jgi:hypothetical protein
VELLRLCFDRRCLASAVLYLFASWSLLSIGSTCRNACKFRCYIYF